VSRVSGPIFQIASWGPRRSSACRDPGLFQKVSCPPVGNPSLPYPLVFSFSEELCKAGRQWPPLKMLQKVWTKVFSQQGPREWGLHPKLGLLVQCSPQARWALIG
jgi:hypothetical protein